MVAVTMIEVIERLAEIGPTEISFIIPEINVMSMRSALSAAKRHGYAISQQGPSKHHVWAATRNGREALISRSWFEIKETAKP